MKICIKCGGRYDGNEGYYPGLCYHCIKNLDINGKAEYARPNVEARARNGEQRRNPYTD